METLTRYGLLTQFGTLMPIVYKAESIAKVVVKDGQKIVKLTITVEEMEAEDGKD